MSNVFRDIIEDMHRKELIDFDALADLQTLVYLPAESPTELKVNVVSAIKAYNGGYASIDYIKKHYGKKWGDYLNKKEGTSQIREIINVTLVKLEDMEKIAEINIPGNIGYVIARGALWRLQTSFKAALHLLRNSYYYETLSVTRLIFEQLAWIYKIYEFDTAEEILKISPTKSIGKIKNIYPEAGALYGFLSEHAHISSNLVSDYIHVSDSYSDVILKSPQNNDKSAYIILSLIDLYCIIIELIFYDFIDDCSSVFLDEEGKTLYINDLRDFKVNYLDKYEKKTIKQLGHRLTIRDL